ncbi:MAG: deoxyribodipyrimidine photo-lyase [Bdellovibrionales bacterium]|nr:deoxyribodipyrimidine photo-lyase [Bdellovibrionales bacterium]
MRVGGREEAFDPAAIVTRGQSGAKVIAPWALHWFRRDLRVAGNAALQSSFKKYQGRVVGVFCFDGKFLSRDDFSHDRFQFFIHSLQALREELRSLGSDLLILDQGPEASFSVLGGSLKASGGLPASVTFSRDYEPFARDRDARMGKWFQDQWGVTVESFRDHLVLEPHEVTKPDGSAYQVFGAYKKRWLQVFQDPVIQQRVSAKATGLTYLRSKKVEPIFSLTWKDLGVELEDQCQAMAEKNQRKVSVPIPEAGSKVAYEKLKGFSSRHMKYAQNRDIPGVLGTSQLSIYFKNGSLTTSQAIADLAPGPSDTFLSELIWREFYYSILFHFPSVEADAFLAKFRKIPWVNRPDWFQSWKDGRTGYPIVDAGMRQLLKTGWMHNRVRMIVASFLTKDLHIDYRWGERYFMEKLLDGDLAPNNGGWQWAASTGCDPQPYFRIFNPTLQGKRFDPEGDYVRRWIPELSSCPTKWIHEPAKAPDFSSFGYPLPVCDHSIQSRQALAMYSRAAEGAKQ